MGWAPLLVWKSQNYLSSSFVTRLPQRDKVHAQLDVYKAGSGFLEKQSQEGIAAWNDGKGRENSERM